MNKAIYSIIICCFCIFTCEPKEEIKKIGNIDKPLNLSLLFCDEGGIRVSYDTIDGKEIETLLYPYSINVINDSIIFTARKWDKNKEYRGKLTGEQHLKIKNMVSALNKEYEIPSGRIGPYGGWLCILEIDNQVHYKHGACAGNPEFTILPFSPMPKEIWLLFRYIVDLSPIRIMWEGTSLNENIENYKSRQMANDMYVREGLVCPLSAATIVQQKGTFSDKRDGKIYKTVKIGEQVWMAENLNYNAKGSKCYNDSMAYCDKYGKLYNWNTAMALPDSCKSKKCDSQVGTKHKGICPKGWHLPSVWEWGALTEVIGCVFTTDKYLKATSGWSKNGNGEDKYGFSALPSGYSRPDGVFYGVGYYGYWWSATEDDVKGNLAYYRDMDYYNEYAYISHYGKSYLRSVRCLQD